MKGRKGNDLAAILLALSLNRKIFRLKRAEREILSSVQSLSCVQLFAWNTGLAQKFVHPTQ